MSRPKLNRTSCIDCGCGELKTVARCHDCEKFRLKKIYRQTQAKRPKSFSVCSHCHQPKPPTSCMWCNFCNKEKLERKRLEREDQKSNNSLVGLEAFINKIISQGGGMDFPDINQIITYYQGIGSPKQIDHLDANKQINLMFGVLTDYVHNNMFKTCIKCKISKPVSHNFFYKRKQTSDGLYSYCRKCRCELSSAPKKNKK